MDNLDTSETSQPERRFRTMTEKGVEQYMEQRDALLGQLEFTRKLLNNCVSDLESSFPKSLANINNAEKTLKSCYERYSRVDDQYIEFLSHHVNTQEGKVDEHIFRTNQDSFRSVQARSWCLFDRLTEAKMNAAETHSVLSVNSRVSKASNTSGLAAIKRAEAEAAKAKLQFGRQEAQLKREQVNIKIELDLLEQRKDLAAKEAEATYLEKQCNSVTDARSEHDLPLENLDSQDRTQEYVHSLSRVDMKDNLQSVTRVENVANSPNTENSVTNTRHIDVANPPVTVYSVFNPVRVSSEIPNPTPPVPLPVDGNHGNGTEHAIARYMCRKDVLKDRLHSFNGKFEHYVAWKDTFKSVMVDIGASAAEEVDLILRWAGPGSKQINSIKTANSGNPDLALFRAWERLDSQYGSPERVELALRSKLNSVSRITFRDKAKIYELSDILSEIRAVKEKPQYQALLSYLDTAAGVNPTIGKLPLALQNKWRDRALSYKRSMNVLFPPFTFFCDFILDMAVTFNDPSFDFEGSLATPEQRPRLPRIVSVNKTTADVEGEPLICFIHKKGHSLSNCRTFRHKTLEERKQLLKQQGICFRCCAAKHLCKDCKQLVKCSECNNSNHTTAMHVYKKSSDQSDRSHGGERTNTEHDKLDVNIDSRCTELCKNSPGKSCAKIVLVNVSYHSSDVPALRTYAIIDDQSNHSLAKPELFDHFNVGTTATPYSLRSCGGSVTLNGRRSSGFVVESVDGLERLELPILTECSMIPENRNEIPTPLVAESHSHLACIADFIPPLDEEANILLLIGRDLMPAHYVLDQRLGSENQPFAQRLKLGWVIIGECCLDGVHVPQVLNSMKTYIHSNGRPSVIEPCENVLESEMLFTLTKHDNTPGLSWEDKQFIQLMSSEMERNTEGNWVAPLPFKEARPNLPNNRNYAAKRTGHFLSSLKEGSSKRLHTQEFMQALFDNGHAEKAPLLNPTDEAWYLPLFGIYHPKKKDHIRIVFDSSAKYGGLSLNDVLMTGPNLTNSLLGVLMRFRKERVAVIVDIQQMFYSFFVREDHRDFLRFVWPEDNNLDKELVDYRMNVHVFGNSPSPAVATFGLHKTADVAEPDVGSDVKHFVKRNFYVDDGLSSHPTSSEAIDLLKRTQRALQDYGNLRLHKICSNSCEVLAAFDKEDLAKDLKNLDMDRDFPLQRSLGVCWNVHLDTFTFSVTADDNAFTRRGVLSKINGLYDPLGLAAAFTITGKLLLRETLTGKLDWDEQLPHEFLERWQAWKTSLEKLKEVQVPRMYCDIPASDVKFRDLYVYSDASERAVAAVAYLLTTDKYGNLHIGFVLGKAKVAPKHGHTIPRLELCAAVLAVEVYETCRDELDLNFRKVRFYTDSKVVLGYLYNQTKRFYIYVGNRVDRIRNATTPDQWNYVPSSSNPADDATRGVPADDLPASKWLRGPSHVLGQTDSIHTIQNSFPLVLPEEDCEVRTLNTKLCKDSTLNCQRFERFSTWMSVIRGVSFIKTLIQSRSKLSSPQDPVTIREHSQNLVIKALQQESFPNEIAALRNDKSVPRDSRIRNLCPYLDDSGILRVGGRLKNAQLEREFTNPIIIPRHHLSMLLVRHFHEKTQHQGRYITEGAIRNAGLWLLGCKRQVTQCIHTCFQCRRSRANPENPKMSDLPFDRLDPTPPFTNVGIDVFGPWEISARRTRGGQANSKRWALMVTCLVIRAVHIELLEEMTSSCFINALRRFCAIRGEVRIIRSDCGTNFVGSTTDLKANVINVEDRPVKEYLVDSGINWIFNPPHSSHFGGAWERMIGVARKILDAMLRNVRNLTHEVLHTLMAEVSSIINARPLTPVPTDPDNPFPLTPATLLTLKTNHTVKSFKLNDFSDKDLFKTQWKRVQHLANLFWLRWKKEYLPSLQVRRKWQDERPNPKNRDIVLLCDKSEHRNNWPIGVIVNTHIGEDGYVRSVDIRVGKDRKIYKRPVSEIVVLASN